MLPEGHRRHERESSRRATAPVARSATSDEDGIVVGSEPVNVEAYIDFQCPFCKQFELMAAPTLDRLLETDSSASSGTQ